MKDLDFKSTKQTFLNNKHIPIFSELEINNFIEQTTSYI